MTFGRPGSIPEYYVRLLLPEPIRDGADELESHSVQFFSSTMLVYCFSSKLETNVIKYVI